MQSMGPKQWPCWASRPPCSCAIHDLQSYCLTQFTLHIQIIWSAHPPLAKTGELYTVSCKSCGRPGNYEGDKSAIPLCEWASDEWHHLLLWKSHYYGQLYYTLEGKVSDDGSLEDRKEHRPFLLCYLQLSQEGVTRGFIHVTIVSQQQKTVQLDIQSFRRLSWILYNSWQVYQQSFFNSLLYWEPWTPDGNTLELPAVKNQECMDVTSTCWNFKCIDLHFHRVVWRLCRLWTLAVEVMTDCSLAGSWQLQTQNLSQGLLHPQSFNLSENNNRSRFILVVFEW